MLLNYIVELVLFWLVYNKVLKIRDEVCVVLIEFDVYCCIYYGY